MVLCLGDAIEATAIRSVFGDHATSGALALSSTKVNMSSEFNGIFNCLYVLCDGMEVLLCAPWSFSLFFLLMFWVKI